MKIVLLTTDTTHHTFFAYKVNERFPFHAIFIETRNVISSFDTFHPFEKDRDTYEQRELLSGLASNLTEITDNYFFETVNCHESIADLKKLVPDVILVFGTGRLTVPLIQIAPLGCLNLHGGNPEEYRGLDSHLWTIYNRDFNNLMATLHYIDEELDTGDIIFQKRLNFDKQNRLYMLRSINTRVCVELTLLALDSLKSTGRLYSKKQLTKGRYYSFMPSALKEDCVKEFEQYVAKL